MGQQGIENSALWEDNVPLMREGLHKELVKLAYEEHNKNCKIFPERAHVFAALRTTNLAGTSIWL